MRKYQPIKRSDIIAENFAPGVMERLGLDYEPAKCPGSADKADRNHAVLETLK